MFAHGAMGCQIDPSWGGPIELLCSATGVTTGHGMCNPVCGMVHIKEPLLLIDKNTLSFLTIKMVLLNHMSDAI